MVQSQNPQHSPATPAVLLNHHIQTWPKSKRHIGHVITLQALKNTLGFSLLEVLVAIVVLGTALGLIIALFAGGLRSTTLTKDYSKALLLAREKIDEGLIASDLVEGLEEGLEEDSDGGLSGSYRWERSISAYFLPEEQETEGEAGLFQIKVTVYWRDGEKEKKVALQSLATTGGSVEG